IDSKTSLATILLIVIIQVFSVPENLVWMEELVLPMATQIQQVIKAYGFNNEGEGEVTLGRGSENQ
uniref:Uncharacterized protein n=1 Tax=Oncorhynchus mykiss TaxID=8022 RepID=A0A8C7VFY2_ONCMY